MAITIFLPLSENRAEEMGGGGIFQCIQYTNVLSKMYIPFQLILNLILGGKKNCYCAIAYNATQQSISRIDSKSYKHLPSISGKIFFHSESSSKVCNLSHLNIFIIYENQKIS
jgi:hypothetical protein